MSMQALIERLFDECISLAEGIGNNALCQKLNELKEMVTEQEEEK